MSEPQAARAVALLDWLAARPQGACKTEFPGEGQFSDVSTVLRRFCDRGQVGYVTEQGRRNNRPRRRYFARDLCPPAAVLAPLNIPRRAKLAADPNHKPEPRKVAKTAADPATRIAPSWPTSDEFRAAEPRITERTRVTICPSGKDQRFTPTPDQVTPFFAAGKWLPPSPWAAAVAGGAAA